MSMRMLVIHTDGGSRGNPGPAAIGITASFDNKPPIYEFSSTIGSTTNNQAEYQAFLQSLNWWLQLSEKPNLEKIVWKLDSKLVVEQLNRRWKIKEPSLKPLATEIWSKLDQLNVAYKIIHVPREMNRRADALLNQALDAI